jgi:AbrB family looped-hinge helix DNA binding protein
MATPITLDDLFFGHVTVGERGQVVIPAEARKHFEISPGDKLLVFRDPVGHGLFFTKLDSMQQNMAKMIASLEELQSRVDRETEEREEG